MARPLTKLICIFPFFAAAISLLYPYKYPLVASKWGFPSSGRYFIFRDFGAPYLFETDWVYTFEVSIAVFIASYLAVAVVYLIRKIVISAD